jgi:hypothetical protein
MDARLVPHFYEEAFGDWKPEWDVNEAVDQWIDSWLKEQGHVRIRTVVPVEPEDGPGADFEYAMAYASLCTPAGYPAILSGLAPNGMAHCVIVQDAKMIWDPAENARGLKAPFKNDSWIIEWLAKPIVMGAG